MGKAFSSLLRRPPPTPSEGRAMELRKNPRKRPLDPGFVSSPPRTPPPPRNKRPRKQQGPAAEEEFKPPPPPPPSRRATCWSGNIRSPVVGLQPSRCCWLAVAAPVSRVSFVPRSRVPFNWYEPDMWTEVAKYLHGTDLVHLGITCHWFRRLIFGDDSIWGYAFFRDLSLRLEDRMLLKLIVPRPFHRSWRLLYANAFNNTHAYCFRQPEKHIGGVPAAYESEPFVISLTGACLLTSVRPGIWIADMNMVRCLVCNINTCEGTMQVLEARHCELYLEKNFRDGTWEYKDIGSYFSEGPLDTAGAAIFNRDHINTPHTGNILDAKSWIRERTNLLPRARFTPIAVALNSNLKPTHVSAMTGLLSKFKVMRDPRNGEIVSARITQQLL